MAASTLNNLFWKFAERISAQLISLIVSIVLARLLEPSQFGLIAMVLVFIALADTLVVGSFSDALIQKKDADELDFSSVLCFNIGFSICLYIILFFSAPFITSFYGDQYSLLTPVLRVLGLRILISAINAVHNAYVARLFIFKKYFIATISATLVSAVIGVVMAYMEYGVWALVAQQLVSCVVNTFTLNRVVRFNLSLKCSYDRLKVLIPYGSKVLGTSLLVTVFMELRSLIIGKLYSPASLAYFDRGRQFPNLLVANINTSIGAVLFPKMSSQQDDIELVKQTTRKSIRLSSYIMSPLMLGLAAAAEPFVRLILTEKWIDCVPLLQIFCIIFLFQPVHTANTQAIKAIGRSDITLKLEFIKKCIEIVTLLCVMWISVEAIAINMVVLTTLFTLINARPNIKLLGYSFKEQMKDILPNVGMAVLTAIVMISVNIINLSPVLSIITQIILGLFIYSFLSNLFKVEEFFYIKRLLSEFVSKIKK